MRIQCTLHRIGKIPIAGLSLTSLHFAFLFASCIRYDHDTFLKCKNDFSFFDAIEGDKIWARKQIGKKLFDLRKSSFRRRLRNFQVDEDVVTEINDTIIRLGDARIGVLLFEVKKSRQKFFQEMAQKFSKALSVLPTSQNANSLGSTSGNDIGDLGRKILKDIVHLHASLVASSIILIDLKSRSSRDKFSMDIQKNLKQVEEAIINATAKLLRTMHDLTPQCGSIMAIWDDIGLYLCNIVAVPTQGLWLACLLTAIGAFFIYSALFKATTFLFSYEEEKLFGVPAGVKFIPVLVSDDVEKGSGKGQVRFLEIRSSGFLTKIYERMHAKKRQRTDSKPSIQRVAWSQSGPSIASGSWQVVQSSKVHEKPSTISAERRDTEQEEVPVEVPESKDEKLKATKEADKGTLKQPESLHRSREERRGDDERQKEEKRLKKRKSLISLRDLFTFGKSGDTKEKPRSKNTPKSSRPSASKSRQRAKSEGTSCEIGKATRAHFEDTGQAPGRVKDPSLTKPKEQDPSPPSSRSSKVKRKDESSKLIGETLTKDSNSQERPSAERIITEDVQKADDKVDSRSSSFPKGSDRHTKAPGSSSSKRHEKKTQHSREYTKESSSSKSKGSREKVKSTRDEGARKDADKDKNYSPLSPSERKHATLSRTYVTADESLKEKKH
ncbi:hypothetical protein ANCCAN_07496 [Ancylostoma caninum]|uniref:Uncharacterized protein n=1 Tax=Ancylostoma caninum TaxID=29170 RepID=A0A368GQ50_ANCCA|nr:hypothetical protein ANCCAN_07496 [Ancylostoma caninum]